MPSPFKKATLPEFSDVTLYAVNLLKLFESHSNDGEINYVTKSGNKITVKGISASQSMKNTTIYFRGSNNEVVLENIKGVRRLDIVCIHGSYISIDAPVAIRGMTVLSSHGGRVVIGRDCLFSRDILIYSSKAHGLYSSLDGSRRYKAGAEIGEHVWIGQGAKILAGANIGDGSVIGSYSVLAGSIPNNCAAAGNPCRVKTKDIFWVNTAAANNANYFEYLENSNQQKPEFIKMTDI